MTRCKEWQAHSVCRLLDGRRHNANSGRGRLRPLAELFESG